VTERKLDPAKLARRKLVSPEFTTSQKGLAKAIPV
jgi:hypothetical protein